jgi:prepilin-type N-terminal cleavage/methylation domain-containing protein
MPIKNIKQIQSVKSGAGFTLMEIMVATVIFAIVVSGLMTLFNQVLKINRRGEALRQAAQSSRDFVELLVKEIRNGQVDYYVQNGLTYNSTYINDDSSVPCQPPGALGSAVTASPTYAVKSNWLGIINTDNVEECFYFARNDGATYAGSGVFTAPANSSYSLVLEKSGVNMVQKLNPLNARIDGLTFLVRPQNDPYSNAGAGLPKIQPAVAIIIKFTVQLPTGEQVPIYYQTAVSENKYDIPNQ